MTNAGYEIERIETYVSDSLLEFVNSYGVALGRRITTNEDQFVTWEYKTDKNGVYSFFWGHYFSDKNAALADYHQRLADGYERHVKENVDEAN